MTTQTSMDGEAGVPIEIRPDTPTTVVPPATPARQEVGPLLSSSLNCHLLLPSQHST